MIISPTLALTALAPVPFSSPKPGPIICYDSRYATQVPTHDVCISIIRHRIVTPPFNSRPLNFSRRPSDDDEFRIPHTWTDVRGGGDCVVVIDIPELPDWPIPREASSLAEVKRAALDVVAACVVRRPRLGGMAAAGKNGQLIVRVEAR
ncbi:MAG: hypothetical protein Q9225_002217 [Loekoesia sp. 1 TL-2023]